MNTLPGRLAFTCEVCDRPVHLTQTRRIVQLPSGKGVEAVVMQPLVDALHLHMRLCGG